MILIKEKDGGKIQIVNIVNANFILKCLKD